MAKSYEVMVQVVVRVVAKTAEEARDTAGEIMLGVEVMSAFDNIKLDSIGVAAETKPAFYVEPGKGNRYGTGLT